MFCSKSQINLSHSFINSLIFSVSSRFCLKFHFFMLLIPDKFFLLTIFSLLLDCETIYLLLNFIHIISVEELYCNFLFCLNILISVIWSIQKLTSLSSSLYFKALNLTLTSFAVIFVILSFLIDFLTYFLSISRICLLFNLLLINRLKQLIQLWYISLAFMYLFESQ